MARNRTITLRCVVCPFLSHFVRLSSSMGLEKDGHFPETTRGRLNNRPCFPLDGMREIVGCSATTTIPKGAPHGTRRVFDQPDCEGHRGFEEVLREIRFQGLRRECRAELADLEERRSHHRTISGDVR